MKPACKELSLTMRTWETSVCLRCDTPEDNGYLFYQLKLIISKRTGDLFDTNRIGEHGEWGGLHFVIVDQGWTGVVITFYQEQIHDNPHGGYYDFDKLKKMPYLIRKRMELIVRMIRRDVIQAGGKVEETPVRDWLNRPLDSFNASWGASRFRRDARGWPDESELRCWSRKDADGHIVKQGDTKYILYDFRLQRVKVYGGINGMWFCVFPDGYVYQTNVGTLFDDLTFPYKCRRVSVKERRHRIKKVIESAIGRLDFARAAKLLPLIRTNNEGGQYITMEWRLEP